jgi:hypothetical protein
MALEALRQRVGADDFLPLLEDWAATDPNDPATTEEFIALAEAASPDSVTDFLNAWLREDVPPKPPLP